MTGFPFSFSSVSVQHIFHVSLHLIWLWQPQLLGLLPGNSLSLCNNSHKYSKSIRQMIISGAPIWQFCSKLLSNPCYYCNNFHIITFLFYFSCFSDCQWMKTHKVTCRVYATLLTNEMSFLIAFLVACCLFPLVCHVAQTSHTTLCDKVCQLLVTGRSCSRGTLVSSTNKTDHHDINEILLKVALNTINLSCTSSCSHIRQE